MQITDFLAKTTGAFVAVALAFALTVSAIAASGFVGKWETTAGRDQKSTIWLSDDGAAKADVGGRALAGKWTEDGDTAAITWDSGWVTKLTKEGDAYKTTTLKKDGKPFGQPADAKKVE